MSANYISGNLIIQPEKGAEYLLVIKNILENEGVKRVNYEAVRLAFSVGLNDYNNYNDKYMNYVNFSEKYRAYIYNDKSEVIEFSVPLQVLITVEEDIKLMYIVSYALLVGNFPSNEVMKKIATDNDSQEYKEAVTHFKQIVGFGAYEIFERYDENPEDRFKLIFEEIISNSDFPKIKFTKSNDNVVKRDMGYLELQIAKTKNKLEDYYSELEKYKIDNNIFD